MSKRPRILRSQRKIIGEMRVVHPNAAGIDAGSQEHYVSVPEDRSATPVRAFGTMTADLEALACWLIECKIDTVAIESTGVYWIPLYEILEQRGLNPRLVDSRSLGRRNKKTDVLDCQWARQLHTYGLLDAAFRPNADTLPLRAYMRERDMLVKYAADHIRHIQKALDLMNVKLHLVVSDVVGVSGLRIIEAILDGKRKPEELAALRERNCARSEQDFVKALTGNYRGEHLFALRQAVDLFHTYQRSLQQCDAQIEAALGQFGRQGDASTLAKKKAKKRRKNQPHFDGRSLLYQITGVDLTAVPGLEVSSILTILSETGTDMSPWPSFKHFVSWLLLSANNRSSGGQRIYKRTPVLQPNRASQAFRLCAETLERAKCALGAFFRRIQARHGRAVAIKATAAKLARIFYTLLKNKTEYSDLGPNYYETRYRERLLNSLKKNAATLGFTLVPAIVTNM